MSKFQFKAKAKLFRDQKARLLERMAHNAIYAFRIRAFDTQSWNGKKWPKLKNPRSGGRMLVKTGTMRNSIGIIRRTASMIQVGSDVAYAKYHNEGTAKMPRRQFIGNEKKLLIENNKLIRQYLRNNRR